MKVIVDTNIIVSGLLTPYSHAAEIMRLFANGKLTLCYDSRIFSEYFQVLNRPKFNFDEDKVFTVLKEIELTGELATGIPLKESLPDADDNMFLEVALASDANCIITGNLKHFPKELCFGIPVFLPSSFISFYKEKCM